MTFMPFFRILKVWLVDAAPLLPQVHVCHLLVPGSLLELERNKQEDGGTRHNMCRPGRGRDTVAEQRRAIVSPI